MALPAPAVSGTSGTAGPTTLGGVLSAVLKDDKELQKRMTQAEQNAIAAVIKNVGTPDEYGSAAEYVLRALPYVRSVYGVMDVVQPLMPSTEEVAIIMRNRFITAKSATQTA